jgi:hypothetical protein
MGRGGGLENSHPGAGGLRTTAFVEHLVSHDLGLFSLSDPSAEGELIELPDGTMIEIGADDPALLMRGLAQVGGVELQSDGSYKVTFLDGTTALVDLDQGAVAFSDGSDGQAMTAGALYAALAQRASGAPIDFDPETADKFAALAQAQAALRDNPNDPEALRAFAQAAIAAGEGANALPDNISINDPDVLRRLEGRPMPSEEESNSRLARRLKRARDAVSRAISGPDPSDAAFGLLHQVNEDNEVVLPEKEFAERREAASRLAGGADPSVLIPENKIELENELDEDGNPTGQVKSTGEYYLGLEEQAKMQKLRRALDRGQRFFILRGPPGAGKDTFAEQFSALSQRPYRAFTLGGRVDLSQLKGGDSLREQPVYEERWEPVRDAKGKVKKDKEGEPVLEKKMAHVGSIPVTGEQVGELVKWMKEPSCVVLQEPENQQEDLVQMHQALGDRLGDPNKRFVMIDSSSGTVHRVHPDCTIFITHNAREGQAEIPDATKDRALNLDFDYPPVEQEAERLARAVTNVMKEADDSPGLNREYTADELMPMALVAQQARRAHEDGSVTTGLGFRSTVTSYCELLQSGYDQDEDPVTSMCENLEYLLDRNDYDGDERLQLLRDTIIADQHGRLHDIAKAAEKVAAEHFGS